MTRTAQHSTAQHRALLHGPECPFGSLQGARGAVQKTRRNSRLAKVCGSTGGESNACIKADEERRTGRRDQSGLVPAPDLLRTRTEEGERTNALLSWDSGWSAEDAEEEEEEGSRTLKNYKDRAKEKQARAILSCSAQSVI
ncbi:hypothetical protein AXG93_3242s1280 [Marchantia polymorpha subsp. ruderalis]|uniref:Uncharacterized protein n=1 Tax=Marchantia polymorpha subsp. ruderalis TaxID=1480154 RepID=A0A176WJY7_MARPO|nr:hypothetical protein AXG93_3242s1280 [Marchantia polymorpha subsp. ruderalis]